MPEERQCPNGHAWAMKDDSQLADSTPLCPQCGEMASTVIYDALPPSPESVMPARVGVAPQPLPSIPGYEILEILGPGGMGVVFKARQNMPPRLVALKMLKDGRYASTALRQRFHREAEAVAQLRHPNIVPIYEFGEHEDCLFFTMEYMEGGTLQQRLGGVPQSAIESARLVEILARAIHAAHQQSVIHRDLKPSNILLGSGPLGECVAKIADFGLAKILKDSPDLTPTQAVLGTVGYMPPEQASGTSSAIGPAADMYSLGAILYQMLTGRPPFQGESTVHVLLQVVREEPIAPRRLYPSVPIDLETICLACLEKDPSKRYASALDLAEDLRRFQAGEPIKRRPLGPIGRTWRWSRRNPAVAISGGLAIASLLAITVLAVVFGLTQAESNRKLELRLAENYLQLGQHFAEKTEHAEALVAFARGLEILPTDRVDLERVFRLNMGASYARAHRLQGLYPHGGNVHMVIFSPDGKSLITASEDSNARIWDRATGDVKSLPHGGPVWNVAITPDDNTVATASEDGTAALWNRYTGKRLFGLPHPPKTIVNQVRFSHDGKWLVTGADDHYIRIWDVATEIERQKIPGDGQVPHHRNSFSFSTDGKILATTHGAKGLLWRIGFQDPPAVSEKSLDFKFAVDRIAFSSDDRRLLAWDDTGKNSAAHVWDLRTAEPVGAIIKATNRIRSGRISRDGKLVLLGCENGEIHLHDAAGEEKLPIISRKNPVIRLAFHPTKPFIFSAEQSGTLHTYEIASGRQIGSAPSQAFNIESLAFSPDGAALAIAGDKVLGLWKVSVVTGERFATEDHSGSIDCLAFHPSGKSFLTSDGDRLRFWPTATGERQRPPMTHPAVIAAAHYSRDGDAVLIMDVDSKTGLWRFVGDSVEKEYDLAPPPYRVAPSLDGKLIAGTDGRNNIYLWDFATGKLRKQWQDTESVNCLIFVKNNVLSTSSGDDAIKLWEVSSGKQCGPTMHAPWQISSLAVSGNLLLAGHRGGTAQLWDWTTGKKDGAPLPHGGLIESVAFHRDGNVLITGGHQVCLWDRITQKRLGPPLPHDGTVAHLAVSPTEHSFLTSGFQGNRSARLWSLPTEVTIAREHAVLWSQVVTGLEADEQAGTRFLAPEEWRRRRDKLKSHGIRVDD
jgi:eukaryotic-like serine/threonine-protein kinase